MHTYLSYFSRVFMSWAEEPTLALPAEIKKREEEFWELRFIGHCQDCSFLISFCPGTLNLLQFWVGLSQNMCYESSRSDPF